VDAADAFVFVTPEYNHGYPAALKNAIDYLHHEWRHKPVGFVSYGGVASGTRAVEQLQQVVTAVRLMPVIDQVNIPFYQQFIDDNGVLQANDVMEQAADTMLESLLRLEETLRPLRDEIAQAG
jgi:NAD(P)H-dependent FMN reductase